MRRLLIFLTSLSLVSSSSSIVMACETEIIYDDCYDEDGTNVTDKDSNINHWIDIAFTRIFFLYLNKEIFPSSNSFLEMNNKSSDEIVTKYFRDSNGEPIKTKNKLFYNNSFTFLITNYQSIDKNVIAEMKTNQFAQKPGTYLFLNLPEIDITNIKNEQNIDFQFIFIIKDSDGSIKNNNNNNWFYWFDWKTTNKNPNEYFFDLDLDLGTQERVVTKYSN